MDRALIRDTLPPEQRLALAYAPASRRDAFLATFGLDLRLAQVVLGAREPMLAQIRLAWWRDHLADDALAAGGEPLLDVVQSAVPDRGPLQQLVNAWEGLLDEPAASLVGALARARAMAICSAGLQPSDNPAALATAREWALHDLSRLPDPWGAMAGGLAADEAWTGRRLPPALRSLAVLHALARRSRRTGTAGPDPASIVVALRVGLFGR